MPNLSREEHEKFLEELLNPEIEHSRKTEILQQLRTNYNAFLDEHAEILKAKEELEKDNQDLIISNSKLFRQLGVVGQPEEKEVEKKEFSETITIEQLEKGAMM
mgnify:CR=1 FL=1